MKQISKVRLAIVAAAATAMISMQQSAQAQRAWNVASGNFNVAGNWSPAGVPAPGETATINNAGTATLDSFQDVGAIEIASGGGTSGTLAMTAGGDLFVSNNVHVGEQGTGTLTINNAKLDAGPGGSAASIFVGGQNNGGTGTLTMSGGNAATLDADDDFVMGRVGTGTFNMQGGHAAASFTVVGKYGTGVWNQSGGVFQQKGGDIEIGDGGNSTPEQVGIPGPRTGTINLTGGVIQGAGHFAIGNRVGAGIVNVSGGALAMTGDVNGTGTIFVGRGFQWDGQTGAGAATSLRVTGDDGIIVANGGFDMNSSGVAISSTLVAEITGSTHSTIKVTGDALIANGTLAVDLTGYTPVSGDSWTILQAGADISAELTAIDAIVTAGQYPALTHNSGATVGTLQGTFANVDYSQATLPVGLSWNISYDNNAVVLSITGTGPAFSADFNNDGRVDGADLTTWKQSFGGAGADANGDGVSDGADFLTWQQQFGSGVPATAAVGAVPEPASIALLGLAAMGMTAYGRSRRNRA